MEPMTTPDPWVTQFAAEAQPLIVAWFSYAASQRPQTPEALLAIVERLISNKLDWSTPPETRQVCTLTLLALRHQRAGARSYAASVLKKEMV